MVRVLIIGAYGNFGSTITKELAGENDLQLIIAGRSLTKAHKLKEELSWLVEPECVELDTKKPLVDVLRVLRPDIVIHTSGPFQSQGYEVAKACIDCGSHYIDLADGREFVTEISKLNDAAATAKVLIVSGASSLPCLTSALVDYYAEGYAEMHELDYGITTAQKSTRGLATVEAILSYTGKPFTTLHEGKMRTIFGWQGMRLRSYPELGRRLLSNCDVPDLSLFPIRYPQLKSIRFFAGLELPAVHASLWLLSWLVRYRLVWNIKKFAPILLKVSYWFDRFGTSNSGFHLAVSGIDHNGASKRTTFELTARSGDGPRIPTIPAILITKKLARDELHEVGALPCMGLVDRYEYLTALAEFDISWREENSSR